MRGSDPDGTLWVRSSADDDSGDTTGDGTTLGISELSITEDMSRLATLEAVVPYESHSVDEFESCTILLWSIALGSNE